MLHHWSNSFRRISATVMGPTGLLANILLIFIIKKYTPESVKTYSTMIMVITIADAVNAFCGCMTSTRMFPTNNQLFVMFEGFCEVVFEEKTAKSRFCMFWYAAQVDVAMLNHVILIFSYIYRVIVITRPFDNIDRKSVQRAIYGYTVLHIFYMTSVNFMSWSSNEEMDTAISKVRPELIGSNWTYSGILDLNAPSQIGMNILSMTIVWIVLLVAMVCRWQIGRYLNKYQFSSNLKQQHKSLVNVLLSQTISPLLSAISVSLYIIIGQTGAPTTAVLENIMPLPLLLMSVASPIFTVAFIFPYRNAFLNIIRSFFSTQTKDRKRLVTVSLSMK